ncbi:c-type cytochrome [Hyphococcus sp.]|jgi:cytochrome c5|uniref:c-type cytochrome n=1 Tax=Hyphococcus sp. TaxID=2038636 RepID=UPI0035C6B27F
MINQNSHWTLMTVCVATLAGVAGCGDNSKSNNAEDQAVVAEESTQPVLGEPVAETSIHLPENDLASVLAEDFGTINSPEPLSGEALYDRHCSGCHNAGLGHPGTMMLEKRGFGDEAPLEQRAELPAEFVKQIVRQGLIEMPPFRSTDITDADLDRLADYLANN